MPIHTIKYMSAAMRRAGHETLTLVEGRYAIHNPDDFDADTQTYLHDSMVWRVLGTLLREYAVLARLMQRYDVFHGFFDGGYLRRTAMRFAESRLIHLAGKKVVVMPYGSDVAVPTLIRSLAWRHGLALNYPALGRDEVTRLRWIRHYSSRADWIVACLVHLETLPRWDLLTLLYYPIDTEEWTPHAGDSGHNGVDGPVSVVHTPNHRSMKGTDALIRACAELQLEGLQVDLRLIEGVPNRQVREEIDRADILAEQFILGYALSALEGMSLAKPVLSNLSEPGYYEVFLEETRFSDCPIVSTTPGTLKENLRTLVQDPARRRQLGTSGRAYVEREHSFAAMSRLWTAIYARMWDPSSIDPATFVRPGSAPPHR